MSTAPAALGLRIGEVAQRAGTTPRTIRYYEELGLLPSAPDATPAVTACTARPMSSGCRSFCA